MQAAFKGVTDAVAGAPRPRVFYELDATGDFYGPRRTIVPRRDDRARRRRPDHERRAGRYDIAAERLVAADPEVILLGDATYGVTPEEVASPRLGP